MRWLMILFNLQHDSSRLVSTCVRSLDYARMGITMMQEDATSWTKIVYMWRKNSSTFVNVVVTREPVMYFIKMVYLPLAIGIR